MYAVNNYDIKHRICIDTGQDDDHCGGWMKDFMGKVAVIVGAEMSK